MVVSVVSSEVPGDHVPPAGAVGAGGTLVRFLPRVSPLVGGEVVRPAEHLPTHLAAVRLVARVEPHVAGEHVAAGEGSLADLAEVGPAAGGLGLRGPRLGTVTVRYFKPLLLFYFQICTLYLTRIKV